MDLSVYCRVCMNYNVLEYIDLDSPLNNSTYLEHFNFCTKLNVVLEDELPKTICISCAKSLQIAYKFIKSAVESERFLRDNFCSGIPKDSDDIKVDLHNIEDFNESIDVEYPEQIKEEAVSRFFEVENVEIQPKFEIVFHEEEPIENQTNSILLSNEKDSLAVDNFKEKKIVTQKNLTKEVDNETIIDLDQEETKFFRCTKCDEAFVTHFDLKDHESEVHKNLKDSLVCRLCGETFINRTRLTKHQNVDHKDKEVGFCIVCNKSFVDENGLRKHVTKEHSRVVCECCEKSFTVNTIKIHLKEKDVHSRSAIEKEKLTCNYCSKIFIYDYQLKEHLNTHTGIRPYSCEICGNSFHSRHSYTTHFRRLHDSNYELPEPRKCTKCDFSTSNRLLWIQHQKKRHAKPKKNIKRYLCSFCPHRFCSPKELTQHESFFHGDQKLAPQCHICDKKFANQTCLRSHMSRHSEERRFKCKICPKTFKQLSTLSTHERLHKDKELQCPQCDKKYAQRADLRVHMRTHTGELPFECHLCDKKFAIKVRLTYHLKKHEGVLSKCPHCPREFPTMAQVRMHVFEHIGYPYICDHCDMGYERKRGLFRHAKRVHQIIMTEEELKENHLKNTYKFYRSEKETSKEEEELTEI